MAGDDHFFQVNLALLQFYEQVMGGLGFYSFGRIADEGDYQGVDAGLIWEGEFSVFVGEGVCFCVRIADDGRFKGFSRSDIYYFAGDLLLGVGGFRDEYGDQNDRCLEKSIHIEMTVSVKGAK